MRNICIAFFNFLAFSSFRILNLNITHMRTGVCQATSLYSCIACLLYNVIEVQQSTV